MSNDIVEILRKHQLKRIQKSESFAVARERHMQNRTSYVKCLLSGKDPNIGVPLPVVFIRSVYKRLLESYTGQANLLEQEMNKSSIAMWTRIEEAREKAGCDAERYIKAQFVWFDKAYGKAPSIEQLATASAVDRAIEFAGPTEGRVLSNGRKAPITKADIFRASEKLLQSLMEAQGCNREEFYSKFVLTGLYSFPDEFLKLDPTYQRLINR
jgi:hypothetical protein